MNGVTIDGLTYTWNYLYRYWSRFTSRGPERVTVRDATRLGLDPNGPARAIIPVAVKVDL